MLDTRGQHRPTGSKDDVTQQVIRYKSVYYLVLASPPRMPAPVAGTPLAPGELNRGPGSTANGGWRSRGVFA